MGKKNRVAEAFKENFNLVGMAGAAAISLATLNPLPLLVGVIAEAAYLLFVPDSRWYDVRLSRRFDAEIDARRAALKADVLPRISISMQERFARLEDVRRQVGANPPPGDRDAHWFREVLRKLDYLLEKFLRFADQEARFRAYLFGVYEQVIREERSAAPPRPQRSPAPPSLGPQPPVNAQWWMSRGQLRPGPDTLDSPGHRRAAPPPPASNAGAPPPAPGAPNDQIGDTWARDTVRFIQDHYRGQVSTISAERDAQDDLNTKAVLAKRVEVLEQRVEYIGKIGKILVNLGHQMQLLEDSFGLINDQLRARSPEQILSDIEGVVYQTDAMTTLLEELAPFETSSDGPP
jgi:hypothetical protein